MPRSRYARSALAAAGLLVVAVAAPLAGAGAAGAAGSSIGGAPALGADSAADGRWWFDAFHVGDAHAAGYTGSGVTIAVLDGPLYADLPALAAADLRIQDVPACYLDGEPAAPTDDGWDVAFHGTAVAALLVGSGVAPDGGPGVPGVAPGATILYYRTGGNDPFFGGTICEGPDGSPTQGTAAAVEAAIDAGADIITISEVFGESDELRRALARAVGAGVIVVTGVSNDPIPADGDLWSTRVNGAVAVQALGPDAAIAATDGVPHTNPSTDVVGPGLRILTPGSPDGDWSRFSISSGTSLATPIVAGFLAVVAQKYPEATPDQLLQSLIRNTGSEEHALEFDESGQYGYGVASMTRMLRADPTQYDDVNPLIVAEGDPSPELIASGGVEPTAEPSDPPTPGGGPDALIPILILIGVAAVVVVVAVVILIVVLARRAVRRDGARG